MEQNRSKMWRQLNTRIATDAYDLMRAEAREQSQILGRNVTNGEVIAHVLRVYLGAAGRAGLDPHILSRARNSR